jgi:hypothetical protein
LLRLRRCWRWASLSEEHVAHTDEAEISNKERTIQRLVDDRDMWRALGKTFLAERAEEAIARLRDAKPAHNSKGRGRDPYETAILRAEKARRRATAVRDQERQRSVPSRAGDQC